MSNTNTLEINLNEDYRIKIENGNYFEKSIFSDIYKTATESVIEIINQSGKKNEHDDFNNIIAFTGERGKGKSSSMLSFRDALIHKTKDEHNDFFNKVEFRNKLSSINFAGIDVIDPSLYGKEETLLEIILAKMFQRFQTEITVNENKINHDDRRAIIKKFQEVFENLQIQYQPKIDFYKKETIEALSQLATSSNLKASFKELVDVYLKKFEGNKDYLVVAIDDFDLNLENAYDMLEEVRRFLIQSNIILLVACKIEQLEEVLKVHYTKRGVLIEIENKIKKYLDKLFPFNRRLLLPELTRLEQNEFIVLKDGEEKFRSEKTNFKYSFLKFVYQKTDLFLSLDRFQQNVIIPKTLRQAQNVINTIFTNDLNKLRGYILEDSKSNQKAYDFLKDIDQVSDEIFLVIIIGKLSNLLNDKIDKESLLTHRERIFFQNIRKITRLNIPERASIGDLFYVIEMYENSLKANDTFDYNFINFVKVYLVTRLKSLKNNKYLNFNYGFINEFTNILPTINGVESRDIIDFNRTYISDLDKLNEDDKIFFSLWIKSLGGGYEDYRNDISSDIFNSNYKEGKISPFGLLYNISNLYVLSDHFNFSKSSELVNVLLDWFDESEFIKQLSNISFLEIIINDIRDFSRSFKDRRLSDYTYFDYICLRFIYGIIYSLDKVEKEHGFVGLVDDLVKNPIISAMIRIYNEIPYKINFNIISDLNNDHDILTKIHNTYFIDISDDLIKILNNIYSIYSKTDDDSPKILSTSSKVVVNEILLNLRWNLENRTVTSRIVSNRVPQLRKHPGTAEIVRVLDILKKKLNNPNTYEQGKREIIEYINSVVNG